MAAAAAQKLCPTCMGRGAIANPYQKAMQVCPNCNGQGSTNQQVLRVPFDYAFNGGSFTLAASATGQQSFQVDQDTDFEWIWIVANSTGAFTVQLVDSSTGRALSNGAINNVNMHGTAQLPFPLVEPYLLARSTTFKGTFVDTSGAQNTIQFLCRGYKLFPASAPQQGSSGQVVQTAVPA